MKKNFCRLLCAVLCIGALLYLIGENRQLRTHRAQLSDIIRIELDRDTTFIGTLDNYLDGQTTIQKSDLSRWSYCY